MSSSSFSQTKRAQEASTFVKQSSDKVRKALERILETYPNGSTVENNLSFSPIILAFHHGESSTILAHLARIVLSPEQSNKDRIDVIRTLISNRQPEAGTLFDFVTTQLMASEDPELFIEALHAKITRNIYIKHGFTLDDEVIQAEVRAIAGPVKERVNTALVKLLDAANQTPERPINDLLHRVALLASDGSVVDALMRTPSRSGYTKLSRYYDFQIVNVLEQLAKRNVPKAEAALSSIK